MYYERVLYMPVDVFCSNEVINNLVTELPNYLAAATDFTIPCAEDKVKWWRQQSDNLTHCMVFNIYEGAAGGALVCNR